jgi:hypothetical protein
VRGLPAPARSLLQALERTGSARAGGPAVKELERRLLVHTEEVHTESGRHEILLEPWLTWSRRRLAESSRMRPGASAHRSPHSPGRNARAPQANRRRSAFAPLSTDPITEGAAVSARDVESRAVKRNLKESRATTDEFRWR